MHRQAIYVEPELRGFFATVFSDASSQGRIVGAFDDSVALLDHLGAILRDDNTDRSTLKTYRTKQHQVANINEDDDIGSDLSEFASTIQTLSTDARAWFSLREIERVKAQRILENERRFSAKILRRSKQTELSPHSSGQVWRRGCDDMVWADLQASVAPEFNSKVEHYENYQVKWSVSVFVADESSDWAEYYGEYLIADYGCAELSMHLVFVDHEEYPEGLKPVY